MFSGEEEGKGENFLDSFVAWLATLMIRSIEWSVLESCGCCVNRTTSTRGFRQAVRLMAKRAGNALNSTHAHRESTNRAATRRL